MKFQGQPVASNEVASQVIMAEPHQKPLPVGFCGIRDLNRTGGVESCESKSGTKTNTVDLCVQVWDYIMLLRIGNPYCNSTKYNGWYIYIYDI